MRCRHYMTSMHPRQFWHYRPRVVWGVGYIFKQQEALLALVVTSQGRTMVTVRHSDSDVVAMMMLITVHCA